MEKVFVCQGGLGFMGRLLTWLVGGIWLIVTPWGLPQSLIETDPSVII